MRRRSFAVEVQEFSPRDVLDGKLDRQLQPLDAVTIFSSARLPRTVVIDGEVMRPGSYTISPAEHLSSVLKRAGGLTPRGELRSAVFSRASAAQVAELLHL